MTDSPAPVPSALLEGVPADEVPALNAAAAAASEASASGWLPLEERYEIAKAVMDAYEELAPAYHQIPPDVDTEELDAALSIAPGTAVEAQMQKLLRALVNSLPVTVGRS